MTTTYRLVHSPWTTREPHVLREGLDDLEDAKEALQRRASFVERHYGAQCYVSDDGLALEIHDDEALMIGGYQGITTVEVEHDD